VLCASPGASARQIPFDFQSHRTYVHRSKRQRRHLALDLGSVKASFKTDPASIFIR
jgi:hypothetical protein